MDLKGIMLSETKPSSEVSILLKGIYRFRAICSRTLMTFSTELEQIILKFI